MISGPVLAAGTNSPLLFGRELWAESRIALFKQSLDTRHSKNHLRKKIPRVYFGEQWLQKSPVELWKNELIRFPLIITSDDLTDSLETIQKGNIPDLRAIRLHNGTTYTWNRLCYGPGKSPHLRIECRYLPAGPSAVDEIANFVFWVGLMYSKPENWSEMIKDINFRSVKSNFIKAARNGIESVFNWQGKRISAKELILDELLPMAEEGLSKLGINTDDTKKYLSIIEKRVSNDQTGSQWTVDSYRKLSKKHGHSIAKQEIVAQMIEYQKQNIPVHDWDKQVSSYMLDIIDNKEIEYNAGHFMSTNIHTVQEETSLDLVKAIFEWKNIHHLPVENNEGKLSGIITDGLVKKESEENKHVYAEDIMNTAVISVNQDTKIEDVVDILMANNLSGVPVVRHDKLVGIITRNDIPSFF
jgi:CBS domain-containing protein